MDLTGLGSVAEMAKGIIDKIFPDRMSEAQKSVMVAEMGQGDTYTKRARPTIVYAGLLFIFLVHVAFPIITYISGRALPELSLPTEFWWSYTGVCGVWIMGRSMEKNGANNKIVNMVTGSK